MEWYLGTGYFFICYLFKYWIGLHGEIVKYWECLHSVLS